MSQHRTVANSGIKALNNNPEVIIAQPKNIQVWIQEGVREKKQKRWRGGEERKYWQRNKHIQR